MRRLAKNLILATATVSAVFFVDLSTAEAENSFYEEPCIEKNCPLSTDVQYYYLDFWGKFRDTVMPRPDEPQNNNPPKEMKRPPPAQRPSPERNTPAPRKTEHH
ncbi:MAG: hypothetical protein IJQ85_09045 [Selenomonadaceae bacterium]|nr:hypothetical protein [Selenomonadaceae bacterium]